MASQINAKRVLVVIQVKGMPLYGLATAAPKV